MLPQGRVAPVPQRLVPDVHPVQVVRVVPKHGSQAVQHRQPVALVPLQQGRLGPGEVVLLRPPQGEHLSGVTPLRQDAAQLPGVPDGHRPLVDLPADAVPVRVVARSGQHDPNRLVVGGSGRAGHHVPQLPVRLGVELIEDHAAGLVAVLGVGLRGEHLHQPHRDPAQAAVLRLHPPSVFDPLLGSDDLQLSSGDHFGGPGGGLQHEHRRPEHDARIVLIRGAEIHLRVQLPVTEQVIQAQGGGQLALSVLLGDLQIEILILPQQPAAFLVPLHGGVELHQRLPLPLIQPEGLPRVRSGQALHKVAHKAPALFVPLLHGSAPRRPGLPGLQRAGELVFLALVLGRVGQHLRHHQPAPGGDGQPHHLGALPALPEI